VQGERTYPCYLVPASLFSTARLQRVGTGKLEVCCSAFLLLLLLRGSLPRMPSLRKLLDHPLIKRGYIGRLPACY
jgi:hypothetical protein